MRRPEDPGEVNKLEKCDYKQWDSKLIPLPCPFCGKIPSVLPENPEIEGDAFGIVKCTNGNCAAKPKVEDGAKICDLRGPGAYKDMAIKRWNKRVPLKER